MARSTTSDECVTGSAVLTKSGTTACRRSLAEWARVEFVEHGQVINESCPSEQTGAVLRLAWSQRETKVYRGKHVMFLRKTGALLLESTS